MILFENITSSFRSDVCVFGSGGGEGCILGF